jgi:hypothetical protein
MDIHEKILKANLPDGSIWNIESESDLDKFLEGMGDNLDEDKDFVKKLADIRNPLKTQQLEDLEKEFGLSPNSPLSEEERRIKLLGEKTDNNSTATHEWLQDALQKRGFENIVVLPNTPGLINPGAFGGELIVNGEGDSGLYQVPSDSGYWGLFFFLGSGVTYKDVDVLVDADGVFTVNAQGIFLGSSAGEITSITPIEVDAARREELRREIIKYKPLFAWGVLIATYI